MTKVKSMKKQLVPVQLDESPKSEVSDLLKSIEDMGRKAGCMLEASKDSLAVDEVSLLEDVQALGVRAEQLMVQKLAGSSKDQFVISKSLSRTDIGRHLTLTSVEEKLNELHILWGQHGQVIEVTDLTDNEEMEFTFVIWSHHKGRRGVVTGGWKFFCRKHGLRVGDQISISAADKSNKEYILSAGETPEPLAVLKCKKATSLEMEDPDADGEMAMAGNASTNSMTASGETSSPECMQNKAGFGESRNLASIEEGETKQTTKFTEDEKVFELADYLFKLSRWASPLKNPRTS